MSNATYASRLTRWRTRFIDYSRERDGEPQDLTWAQFGKRLRAVAARLQQVTARGDRVAILAPQNSVSRRSASSPPSTQAMWPCRCSRPTGPAHRPARAVLADCTPAAILTSTKAAEAVRDYFAPCLPSGAPG